MDPVKRLDEQAQKTARALLPSIGNRDLLVFDGECRFCQAQVTRLLRWTGDTLGKAPLQTPGLLEALGIETSVALSAMHLVTAEGAIYRGLEAVVQALRHRPILGRLVKAYYVPGFRQLGDLGYRLVARYRYAIMGRAIARGECDEACAIHLGGNPAQPKISSRASH